MIHLPPPTVGPQAFLVMALRVDGRRPLVHDIDLFSEPNPTQDLVRIRQFVVATGYGLDYEAGIKNLRSQVSSDPARFAWMRPVLSDHARQSVFPDRATRRLA